jgi:hypothetical protein
MDSGSRKKVVEGHFCMGPVEKNSCRIHITCIIFLNSLNCLSLLDGEWGYVINLRPAMVDLKNLAEKLDNVPSHEGETGKCVIT